MSAMDQEALDKDVEADIATPEDNPDQEFDDAFAEFTRPEEGPENEGDDTPDPEPEPEGNDSPPDPWADAPEELVKERDELRQQLEHARQSDAGRQRAYVAKIQELEQQVANSRQGTGVTGEQVREAMRDPEKFAALKEDYPEIGEAVGELAAGLRQEFDQALNSRMEKVEQFMGSVRQSAAEAAEQAAFAKIEEKHEGWRDTVNTEEFDRWFASQPKDVQTAVGQSTDPGALIWALDTYKAATAPASPPTPGSARKARLAQAATPQGINKAAARRREIPNEFNAAFDHYADRVSR